MLLLLTYLRYSHLICQNNITIKLYCYIEKWQIKLVLLLTQWAVLRNQASSKIMDCLGRAHIKQFRTSKPITHMISTTYSMADWERGKDSDSMTQLFLGQGPMHSNYLPTALVLSRSKQQKHDTVPGPGSYEPDFHKIVKNNSSYKIGKEEKQVDYSKAVKFVPGPGQYQTAKSTLVGLNQAAGFGPERKIQLGINPKTPGPGQYNQAGYYNGSAATQPNVVFSKSNRSLSTNTLVPGPGSYLLKTQLQQSVKKSKGFKMGEKLEAKEHSEKLIPGPGAYNASSPNLTKKSTPSFSLGKEPKLKIQNFRQIMSKPGPLKYENKITALEHRSVVIGKDKRKGLGTQSNVPGPGTYEYKTLINSTHTFSVPKSQRINLADDRKIPGPFQYNPKSVFNTQYQSIGIGSDRRRTFEIKQEVPGPGKYLQEQKKSVGGFNFGKQKRDHEIKKVVPGPGQYQISSTIANLPTYAKK